MSERESLWCVPLPTVRFMLSSSAELVGARRLTPTSAMAEQDELEAELYNSSEKLLREALSRMVSRLNEDDEVRNFIAAHAAWFSSYIPGGECMLEWTDIHHDYVRIAEECFIVELQCLGCSEKAMLDLAQREGEDPDADELLTRLLAMTDFDTFCAMMFAASRQPPSAEEEDDDLLDELPDDAEETHLDGNDDDDDDDEGLAACERRVGLAQVERLEQALANIRVAP